MSTNLGYIVFVDYNLARFRDVKLMSDYAKSEYGLSSILIRKNPSQQDFDVADIVINSDPRSSRFVEDVLGKLMPHADKIKAVLPFSDDAVVKGSLIAEYLGKLHDSSNGAQAAFSKLEYRKVEKGLKELLSAQNVFVPQFKEVNSFDEVKEFSQGVEGFVIKPTSEGNNRGVARVDSNSSLNEAYDFASSHGQLGMICEELIKFPVESSYDGVGSCEFVTEKLSRSSKYPVEYGQIVPARYDSELKNSIIKTGRLANFIVGQSIGPFHNEIKSDPQSLATAVIEPNRRPAGMKIWYLAEKVYGVNFFKLWIDTLLGKKTVNALPPAKGIAAIRQFRSFSAGVYAGPVITKEDENKILADILAQLDPGQKFEWFDFKINLAQGKPVFSVPKDNSEHIAEICFYSNESNVDLEKIFDQFESLLAKQMNQWIQQKITRKGEVYESCGVA